MKNVTVKIKRSTNAPSGYSVYSVPADETMSVMDLLVYIYENVDNTLAFFHHEACHHMACGKCVVKVNGKNCMACGRAVTDDELVIEPKNDKVVRDLVCEE